MGIQVAEADVSDGRASKGDKTKGGREGVMDKLVRAVRSYAARRYLPLNYFQDPPPKRPQLPDATVVMRDFCVVLNDLSVATHRVMKKHDYEREQTELFSG